jgi:glutamate N-acetyltransferase/amino-acid N-acetyltransferase
VRDVIALPRGFAAYVANIGVKDDRDDFVVIAAERPVAATGVFTRSRFAAPCVVASREHLADLTAQAVVVVSRNANVANGPAGAADNLAVMAAVADRIGCSVDDVVLASTGVIGRRYPIDRMLDRISAMPTQPPDQGIDRAARAMMTTDTRPKIAEQVVAGSDARIVGVAKGAGMIEPDMATMIAVVLTDADVPGGELDARFREVVEQTLNCVSIDTDTSTSDTAVVLASGEAGVVEGDAFAAALHDVVLSLAKQIASDGEGAEKLIEVRVDGARDRAQAKRVAKAIVNSPLVKTAVHGADPNWGRVAMAIGKCYDDADCDIDPDRVVIRFGGREVYPARLDEDHLAELSGYLRQREVVIHVSLGTGSDSCAVWGCDLTAGYVRINADYTT